MTRGQGHWYTSYNALPLTTKNHPFSTSIMLLRNPVVIEYFQDTSLTTSLAPLCCKTALRVTKVFFTFGGDLSPSSFTP